MNDLEHKTSRVRSEMEIDKLRNKIENYETLVERLESELSDVVSPEYVSEQDWNEDAHVGKITLTIKDARLIYKLVGKL